MTRIEEIAGKLTKAQRGAILLARSNSKGDAILPVHRDRGVLRMSLEELGLCNAVGRLNKDGLAVRDHLMKEQGE